MKWSSMKWCSCVEHKDCGTASLRRAICVVIFDTGPNGENFWPDIGKATGCYGHTLGRVDVWIPTRTLQCHFALIFTAFPRSLNVLKRPDCHKFPFLWQKFASKRETGVDDRAQIDQLLRLAIFVFEACRMLGAWKRLPPPTWPAFYGLGFVRND